MVISSCIAAAATTVDTFDDWAAELSSDGTYALVSCIKEDAEIIVPDAFNGKAVTSVAPHTFIKNSSMQFLTVPEGVTSFGDYACLSCTSLKDVTLPTTLNLLGEAAFSGDSALTHVNLGDTVITGVEAYTFANTALSEIELPSTCESISDNAFLNCGSLLTVTIPCGVTQIGESAFSGCDQLTILCDKGSYAAAYAEEHGIDYCYTLLIYPYLRGDADGDGIVSIMDATHIQRCLAKFEIDDPEAVTVRGDVDGDGLTILDATSIQRKLADMGDPYSIGEKIFR